MAFMESTSCVDTLSGSMPLFARFGFVLTSLLARHSWPTARLVGMAKDTVLTTTLPLIFVAPTSTRAKEAVVVVAKTARSAAARAVEIILPWMS